MNEIAERMRRANLSPPQMLTLAVTRACNLRCVHCWVDACPSGSSGHMPTEQAHGIIAGFAAMGGEGIRLTGGEPVCHPDWIRLLRLARQSGFRRVGLQTNAMLLTEHAVSVLQELDFPGLEIQVSMDGATAASHDLVRGKGTFEATLSGVAKLVRAGLGQRLSLFFTEMAHNLEEFPALLEFAEGHGIGSVVSGTLVRCGRAGGRSKVLPPEPGQYRRLVACFDTSPRFRRLYQKLGTMAALEWRESEAPGHRSCALVENPYLSAEGRLYPCVMCHADDYSVSMGENKGLVEMFDEAIPLWSSLLEIHRRRVEALEECRHCREKTACAGGCMGRAWGSSADLWAADDRCATRQALRRK